MSAVQMKRRRDKEESDAAMTIGYAALQCGRENIADIMELIIDRTKRSELRAELFLVMQKQEIEIPLRFSDESRAVFAAVNARTDRQRSSAAAARKKREALAAFNRTWKGENS